MSSQATLRHYPAAPPKRALIGRNVMVHRMRTSIRLEQPMWDALAEIMRRENMTLQDICSYIKDHQPRQLSFTGAVRIFILEYFRHASTEEGHKDAGHGCGKLRLVVAGTPPSEPNSNGEVGVAVSG